MYKSATVSQNLPLTAIMKNCSFFTEKGVLVFFALVVHLCASSLLEQEQDENQDQELEQLKEFDNGPNEQRERYVVRRGLPPPVQVQVKPGSMYWHHVQPSFSIFLDIAHAFNRLYPFILMSIICIRIIICPMVVGLRLGGKVDRLYFPFSKKASNTHPTPRKGSQHP